MIRVRNPVLVNLLLAATIVFSSSAFACECRESKDFRENMDNSAAIFTGKAVSITPATFPKTKDPKLKNKSQWVTNERKMLKVTFMQSQVWKGDVAGEKVIYTPAFAAQCGFAFEPGADYIVYARKDKQTNYLVTTWCSRTAPIEKSAEDMKKLGNPIYRNL